MDTVKSKFLFKCVNAEITNLTSYDFFSEPQAPRVNRKILVAFMCWNRSSCVNLAVYNSRTNIKFVSDAWEILWLGCDNEFILKTVNTNFGCSMIIRYDMVTNMSCIYRYSVSVQFNVHTVNNTIHSFKIFLNRWFESPRS